jgi:hypothetical protein
MQFKLIEVLCPSQSYHSGIMWAGRVLRNKRHHQQGKFNTKSPAPPKASVTFQPCLLLRTGLYLKLLQAASFFDLPVLVGDRLVHKTK